MNFISRAGILAFMTSSFSVGAREVRGEATCPPNDHPGLGRTINIKLRAEAPEASAGVLQLYYELGKPFDAHLPTLVVIEGGPGGDHRILDHFRSHDAAYNVVSFDHRGVGCTKVLSETYPVYEPGLFGSDRAVEDVDAIRRDLLGEDGHIFIYGVSYGGIVAEKYALKYARFTQGIILDSSPYDISYVRIGLDRFRQRFVDEDPDIARSFAAIVVRYPEAGDHLLRQLQRLSRRYRTRTEGIPALLHAILAETDAAKARALYLSLPDPVLEGMSRQIDCEELFDVTAGPYPSFFTVFPQQCQFMAPFQHLLALGPALAATSPRALLMAGGHDPVVPVESARTLSAVLRNAVLFENAMAGHELIEEKPDCAFELIGRFVGEEADDRLTTVANRANCQSPPSLKGTGDLMGWHWL